MLQKHVAVFEPICFESKGIILPLLFQTNTNACYIFYNHRLLDNKNEIQTLREDLLKYCELDTWAMLKFFEKLKMQTNI